MAFKKIEHTATRGRTTLPALHIRKNGQAYLNSAFTREYEIKPKDKPRRIKFDLLYDKDTNRLAIEFNEKGEFNHPIRDNGQIMFYVKGCFANIGLKPISGVYTCTKEDDMFIFQMPDDAKEKKHVRTEEAESANKAVKKTKRRKK